MKVAIFSDVHGNDLALDAVLADIARHEVDAFWVIGDLVALGPAPVAAARRLQALPNATFVRGNTDRYTFAGERPGGAANLDALRADFEALTRYVEFTSSFPWARGALTEAGLFDWLAAIPLEERVVLPDGTRVLLVHAAPGTDDGPGIRATQTDDELTAIFGDDLAADLVIVGHTHIPLDRVVNGVTLHNLGSVSLPTPDDARAEWTLLTADDSGHTLERQFVAYDVAAVQAAFDAVKHPFADGLKAMFSTE